MKIYMITSKEFIEKRIVIIEKGKRFKLKMLVEKGLKFLKLMLGLSCNKITLMKKYLVLKD
jgi:hypothetical protein